MSFAVLVLDCIKVGVTLWEWQNDQGNLNYMKKFGICVYSKGNPIMGAGGAISGL